MVISVASAALSDASLRLDVAFLKASSCAMAAALILMLRQLAELRATTARSGLRALPDSARPTRRH